MPVVVIWIALSFLAGYIAAQKGRSGVGFFFLSVFLSPVVGIIAALVANRADIQNDTPLRMGKSGEWDPIKAERVCPYCAEIVKSGAIVCKHCHRDIPERTQEAEIKAEALDALIASGQMRRK